MLIGITGSQGSGKTSVTANFETSGIAGNASSSMVREFLEYDKPIDKYVHYWS